MKYNKLIISGQILSLIGLIYNTFLFLFTKIRTNELMAKIAPNYVHTEDYLFFTPLFILIGYMIFHIIINLKKGIKIKMNILFITIGTLSSVRIIYMLFYIVSNPLREVKHAIEQPLLIFFSGF